MSVSKELPIRILIVDDHAVVRAGLRMLIDNHQDLKVVGEAANKAETIAAAEGERPHVTLLDLDLGSESGLDFINDLLEIDPDMRILVLTGIRDTELHRRAVRLGAAGIVMKNEASEVLIKAIEKVHAGDVWLARTAISSVLADMRRSKEPQKVDRESTKIAELTEREREIIGLIAQGLGTQQVASRLFISEKTVRNHLSSIYSKLEVTDRLELALYALRHGLAPSQ